MTTERAIDILTAHRRWSNTPFDDDNIIECPQLTDILRAIDKAIEVMTKVHNYDKEMKELEEYLKETRSDFVPRNYIDED